MITVNQDLFTLSTLHTTYAFRIMENGSLEHLYYGKKITVTESSPIMEKHEFLPGNTNAYAAEYSSLSLENCCLEMSSYGKGDIWEPFICIHHADGSSTSDFLFAKYEISDVKEEYHTLPGSYTEDEKAEHLCVTLQDASYQLRLELHYYVYEACDVICRSAKLINTSDEVVYLERLMSTQLDFPDNNYVFTTFQGAWAREMQKHQSIVEAGMVVNASYTGTSSSRANPFIALGRSETSEDYGDCYGLNLIYSGNHYEAVQVTSYGKTRVVCGIHPQSCHFLVEPGREFEAPEAVMAYSSKGYQGMSHCMHSFVREHIVRGRWKKRERPVILNSWEAGYFDINEKSLLRLATKGKEAGIELFVMDDGWFGQRNDDKHSLGDWTVNRKKLPSGLKGICDKINRLGMDFGIWVEPEMVNVDSELYRNHPDWTIEIPQKAHSEGRNQRILDLTREDVRRYIIDEMTKVFSSANIAYVKWDMNRTFTDYYSRGLQANQQCEVSHRYILGLYQILKELNNRFPHILFEGCSAGGNRFDLGMLCYVSQIWASDNTDALCRASIQNGYSYGYPMSVVSAHVSSCPNHQTLRRTPLNTRFNIAAFGIFGYEYNLCDKSKEEIEEIKKQIALYKRWRKVLQFGQFYRGRSFDDGNILEWTCVSEDGKSAVGIQMQKLMQPNTTYGCYKAKGLIEQQKYHFYNVPMKHDICDFGDLVNTVSPVHIKQDSLIHHTIARFVKLDGELEDHIVYGDTLMHCGIRLKQGFGATGFNEEIRYVPDFGSRMYFMEAL